jgi:hypothetical protein
MAVDTSRIVDHIVDLCAGSRRVKAVGLMGSRAMEDHGGGGDWDLCGFVDADRIPNRDERSRMWRLEEPPLASAQVHFGGSGERFVIDGAEISIDFDRIADLEDAIARVTRDADVGMRAEEWCVLGQCPEAVCADIAMCKTLWDPDHVIADLQKLVSPYPRRFKLNMLDQTLFWARYDLKEMKRAAELGDVTAFHIALSELVFRWLRILFAINSSYFRGPKRAMRQVEGFDTLPPDFRERADALVCQGLSEGSLAASYDRAKGITLEIARLGADQGEDEEHMVNRGLSEWPDADSFSAQELRSHGLAPP